MSCWVDYLSDPCLWCGRWSPGCSGFCTWSPGCCCLRSGARDIGWVPRARTRLLSVAHLQLGLGDGEFPYPPLVVHHSRLGAADELRAQHPPGQTQVQRSLGGTGPVPQRDRPWRTRPVSLKESDATFRSLTSTCVVGVIFLEGAHQVRLVHEQLFLQGSQGWSLGPADATGGEEAGKRALRTSTVSFPRGAAPTFASAWAPCTSYWPDIEQSGGSDRAPFLCRLLCCCPPRSSWMLRISSAPARSKRSRVRRDAHAANEVALSCSPCGRDRTRILPACIHGSAQGAGGCVSAALCLWRLAPSSSPRLAPRWERSRSGPSGRSIRCPLSGQAYWVFFNFHSFYSITSARELSLTCFHSCSSASVASPDSGSESESASSP